MNKKSLGFTLIELLVVIAIISLLSSVILASLRDARNKAKAQSVVSTMNQIKIAAELYKTSTGAYPSNGAITSASPLIPNYLPVVPTNSLNSNASFYINTENSTGGIGCGDVSWNSSEIENGKLFVNTSYLNDGTTPKGLFRKYYFQTSYLVPFNGVAYNGPIMPCVE